MWHFGRPVLVKRLRSALAVVVVVVIGTMMAAYFLYRVNQEDVYHANSQLEER